jgi:CheY-like chemotaxis protein
MKKLNKVWIIDDDNINNYLTTLEVKGINKDTKVKFSENGIHALRDLRSCLEFNEDCPDLILLDLHMPVMDGKEFLEQFDRFNKNKIPIVLMSSMLFEADLDYMRRFNVKGFLHKPVDEDSIREVVEDIFEKRL